MHTKLSHADCCPSVEVFQGKNANPAAKNAQPKIFTTYQIEKNLLTAGNSYQSIHYTSQDGTKAITYGNGKWRIQSAQMRYRITVKCRTASNLTHFRGEGYANAMTEQHSAECPDQADLVWQYTGGQDGGWMYAEEGLKVKCTGGTQDGLEVCQDNVFNSGSVTCGNHTATSCSKCICTQTRDSGGQSWCNNDCEWVCNECKDRRTGKKTSKRRKQNCQR